MIKKISVAQYRKMKDLELNFSPTLNIISGTNGTCKTSLLHMISNAFQSVTKKCDWIKEGNCLDTIKKINSLTNPKIESLTRGDKQYNDPAYGEKGTLFTVDYYDRTPLKFRKHNSTISNRYAIKPQYQPKSNDSLPYCPVIYLGLSRLVPFGEFQKDEEIRGIKLSLPSQYQERIAYNYKKYTGINITSLTPQRMGDIKTRADFESDASGIDSNTISAGEDNLFIILTALESLKYYYDSISSTKSVESVLLVDELDATLHPSLQMQLVDLFREYSCKYKIQIIFTTHSLSLLEYVLTKKENVLYLIDNITSVVKMKDVDIYKIKMYLQGITRDDIYISKSIPVFTEDNEARVFLKCLFEYFTKTKKDFHNVVNLFHLVDANIGADNLLTIFGDSYLLKSTMQSICILDGDQSSDYSKYTIILPGGSSPEKVIMDYSIKLYNNDDNFWIEPTILSLNYGKIYFRDSILPDIEQIETKLKELISKKESTHGVTRELSKKAFLKHQRFFELVFKHWINNPDNQDKVDSFYKDLFAMFKKVAEFHGINSKEWNTYLQ